MFLTEISRAQMPGTTELTRETSQSPKAAAAAERQGDAGVLSTFKVIELEYKRFGENKRFSYAFTKFDTDTDGNVSLPVERAAQLYYTEPFLFLPMVC